MWSINRNTGTLVRQNSLPYVRICVILEHGIATWEIIKCTVLFISNSVQTFLMLNTYILTSHSNFLQESPRNINSSRKQVGTRYITYVAPTARRILLQHITLSTFAFTCSTLIVVCMAVVTSIAHTSRYSSILLSKSQNKLHTGACVCNIGVNIIACISSLP